ncbi:MarR family winged helix-turn-helix transcriptional regulator [Phaeodactylibacter luteus]|uniref:MarR family transcriptional regulator n=1 Tax=Phaeodactylibacter luteus TaxID=1564516 RepID=A0A5C6RGQ6_9BACT|nr:MarR family transcriptional regulator [Phaeodactylibacter luteus]TXB61546.1 MarR family transcriptional regulator [Phaeodactylibacter luteus]
MKIEDAIKQTKPFRNNRHKAMVNLIYTHNFIVDQLRSKIKPFGITMQQYNVLRVLRGAGEPISTSVIRERLLDKMADTSRMVNRLHQKGLVTRNECEHDKRLVDISLTEAGYALLEQLDLLNPDMDKIVGSITEEEATTLSNLLDKIRS